MTRRVLTERFPFTAHCRKKIRLLLPLHFYFQQLLSVHTQRCSDGTAVASDRPVLLGKKTWRFCFARRQALTFSSWCLL